MKHNEDNLEFAVSQAVDGVLADHDRDAVAGRFKDVDVHAMAADHQQINALLRAHDPLPPIDFDAFANRISAAIDAEDAHVPGPLPMRPAARSNWTRRLALAAAVTLVAMASWKALDLSTRPAGPTVAGTPVGNSNGNGTDSKPNDGLAIIEIQTVAPTNGTAVVQIGPSDTMVKQGLAMGLNEPRAKSPPRVVISSAESAGDVRPY